MKKLVVAILAVLGIFVGTGLSASAAYPPGKPVVTPPPAGTVLPAGGTVPIKITNLAPNATVTVTIGGVTTTGTADASGVVTVNAVAPSTPGEYTVDVKSGIYFDASKKVTISAVTTPPALTVTLPTGSVVAGSTVPVTGTAAPNATVTLTVGGVTTTAKADATGKFSTSVTAPLTAGSFTLTATVGTESKTATMVVTAPVLSLTLPTGSVVAGSSVPVSGTATPNSTVTLTLNGLSTTTKADASGKFSTSVTAPAGAGTYTLTATVGAESKTASLVVTAAPATTTTTVAPASTVPKVGSNAPFTGSVIGIPLLVAGLVLLVVSRRRRPVVS